MTDHVQSSLLGSIPHGFSTKAGLGGFAGLPAVPMVCVRQVHSADVVAIDGAEPWTAEQQPKADAMVTAAPGCLLGIVTADCAPVLLVDPKARVIGAAHAGWRGAVGGVLENTVEAMVGLGAKRPDIRAVIGPCIAQANYEVDAAFRHRFSEADAAFFSNGRPDHWQFDLPAYAVHRLGLAKIGHVDDVALDTYGNDTRFYSYRRATHRKEPTEGRQISVIGLPA